MISAHLHLPVHGDALEVKVRLTDKGPSGRLVDAAGLDPHEPVLHDVDPTDAVPSGDLIGVKKDVEGVSLGDIVLECGHLNRDTGLELHLDLWYIDGVRNDVEDSSRFAACMLSHLLPRLRSFPGVCCHLKHGCIRGAVGVLEHATLERRVEEVLVNGIVGLGLRVDRDAVLGAVGEKVLAALEGLNELRVTPGGYGGDLRRKGLGAHLEPDLVVPLPGGPVSDVQGAELASDADLQRESESKERSRQQESSVRDIDCYERKHLLDASQPPSPHLLLGDAGPGDGGAEQVPTLI